MLHKAPASFGLVSFLLSKNVERHKIKKNLAIFAGAAPFTGKFKISANVLGRLMWYDVFFSNYELLLDEQPD